MADQVILAVLNVDFPVTIPTFVYSLDEKGPMSLVGQALGEKGGEAARTVVYLVRPALPIYNGGLIADTANAIVQHWAKALTDMACRGVQGDVAGSPDGTIPSGRASFWWGDSPLRAFPSEAVDLTGRGIHCVIVPPSALLNGKRRVDSPEEMELEPKKQEMSKSTSGETAIFQRDTRDRIVERAILVIKALANLPTELLNPRETYKIPAPSLHPKNMPEFVIHHDERPPCFRYRGRQVLQDILHMVHKAYQSGRSVDIGLFGTQGAGRSHLAAATASLLLKSGIPTVFIPLYAMRSPRTSELRDSLVLALQVAGLQSAISDLFNMCCKYPNDRLCLIKFCNRLATTHKLVFIITGYDHLGGKDAKLFPNITFGHVVLFTAGANSKLRREVELNVAAGRSSSCAFYVNGGLSDDDFQGWLQNFSLRTNITFSPADIESLEATTGRTPSLLTMVFQAMKDDTGCVKLRRKHLNLSVDYDLLLADHLHSVLRMSPDLTI